MLSIPFLVVVLLPLILVVLGFHFRASAFSSRTLSYWLAGSALWISEAHRPDMIHLFLGSPILIVLCFSYLHEMALVCSAAILASVTSIALPDGENPHLHPDGIR